MEEYEKELLRCINLCKEEIQKRNEGIVGESTLKQLEEIILPELDKLFSVIKSGVLPTDNERYLNSFANAFTVWGWDMQNPSALFLSLTKLNNDYEKL